jgi:hypothetical protein
VASELWNIVEYGSDAPLAVRAVVLRIFSTFPAEVLKPVVLSQELSKFVRGMGWPYGPGPFLLELERMGLRLLMKGMGLGYRQELRFVHDLARPAVISHRVRFTK